MKTKLFAVLALFSVVSAAANAQTRYPAKSISIWAGLGLSSITTPDGIRRLPDSERDLIDIGYRSGVNLRASVYLPISGRLGTRLGLGWIQKGWTLEVEVPELRGYDDDYYDDVSIRSRARARANYLSAPALLQFNPTSSVHLLAGPVFSFALGCRFAATLEVDGIVTERESADCGDDDVDLELTTADISFMVGAGVNIPISSALSASLEAVFDLGLTDFSPEYGNEGSKNKNFGIIAGVSLPLGR